MKWISKVIPMGKKILYFRFSISLRDYKKPWSSLRKILKTCISRNWIKLRMIFRRNCRIWTGASTPSVMQSKAVSRLLYRNNKKSSHQAEFLLPTVSQKWAQGYANKYKWQLLKTLHLSYLLQEPKEMGQWTTKHFPLQEYLRRLSLRLNQLNLKDNNQSRRQYHQDHRRIGLLPKDNLQGLRVNFRLNMMKSFK